MFEGMQEKLTTLGHSVSEWVEMDEKRGARHERLLKAIAEKISIFDDEDLHGTVRSIVVTSETLGDGTNPIELVALPKRGTRWEVEGIFPYMPSPTGGLAGAVNLELFVASQLGQYDRPLFGLQIDGTNHGIVSTFQTQYMKLMLPTGMGILIRTNQNSVPAAGSLLSLHLLVREFTPRAKNLDVASNSGAHGLTEGRPTENQINFDAPKVPQEQGTAADVTNGGMKPAVPSVDESLNGAPRVKP